MRWKWRQAGAGTAARWALLLAGCAIPAGARAADSAPAMARLQVEPSVGASLALDSPSGIIVQVYLPGSRVQIPAPGTRAAAIFRAQAAAMPGMLLSFNAIEVMTDSAVSLRFEHHAADTTSLGEDAENEGEGGALVILAQFN